MNQSIIKPQTAYNSENSFHEFVVNCLLLYENFKSNILCSFTALLFLLLFIDKVAFSYYCQEQQSYFFIFKKYFDSLETVLKRVLFSFINIISNGDICPVTAPDMQQKLFTQYRHRLCLKYKNNKGCLYNATILHKSQFNYSTLTFSVSKIRFTDNMINIEKQGTKKKKILFLH